MVAAGLTAGGVAAGLAWTSGSPAKALHPVARRAPSAPTATTSTTEPTPSSGTPATTGTTGPAGPPYRIASDTITLVDPTRPSPPRGSVPGAPTRTLRTVIRSPVGAPGPLPLVVFAHGFDTTPETYETLLDTWAQAGYLVAAPDFPGSASDLPGPPTETDIPQQGRDLSFVIGALTGGREGPVDRSRIAVAGHSDGGSSVVMLAEHPDYGDARVAGYVVLAGQIPDGVAGPWDATPAGALLCMVGTNDQYGNLSLTTTAYDTARITKALITIPGGDHEQLFVGSGAVPEEVRSATLRFLRLALGPQRPVSDAELAASLGAPAAAPAYQLTTG